MTWVGPLLEEAMIGKRFNLCFLLVILIIVSCMIYQALETSGGERRNPKSPAKGQISLPDENSHFGISNLYPKISHVIASAGIKWARFTNVRWDYFEPKAPINGRHSYRWDLLDSSLRKVQSEGFNIKCVLGSTSPWAVGTKVNFGAKMSGPPKPQFLDDYGEWIFNIVERYDGDGVQDMPGLRYPVKHWQIDSEIWSNSWSGTPGDYISLLKTAYIAAKTADNKAKIHVANFLSFDPNILIDKNVRRQEKAQTKKARRKLSRGSSFINQCLDNHRYFDIIGFHANDNYKKIPIVVKWLLQEMKKRGYQKPIWIGDAASAPLLTRGKHDPFSSKTKDDLKKETSLSEILGNTNHARYREVEAWFRREQAMVSFKKCVVAMACGVEKIFLVAAFDWPHYHAIGFHHTGILDRQGRPRPVYYTYKLLIQKLDRFESIETLNIAEGIWAYKFIVDHKPIYVLWKDGEKMQTVHLDLRARSVRITNVVSSENGTFKKRESELIDGKLEVEVANEPLLVEILKK